MPRSSAAGFLLWNTKLDRCTENGPGTAKDLVKAVKTLYKYWAQEYCEQGIIEKVGLQDEPYFRYFSYADFLVPTSGLIQIRRYAEINNQVDLLEHFEDISRYKKDVRDSIHQLLIEEIRYFE